jgi:hypothetical protein
MEENPLEDKPIEFAPQDAISLFSAEVDEIMEAIGIKAVFISDESMVADFYLDEEDLKKASEKLGIAITDNDYIAELAAKLHKQRYG